MTLAEFHRTYPAATFTVSSGKLFTYRYYQNPQADAASLEKEKSLQEAMLGLKKRFGKNAVLKGSNYLEGATMRDRNGRIGGHKAK